MKFFIAVFAVLAVFAAVSAFVVPKRMDAPHEGQLVRLEDVDTDGGIHTSPTDTMTRHRRWTCDVFSFESQIVTPNHAACALKCVTMGRNGDHCEGTSCVCRYDTWSWPWE